ncbi:MAG: MFS transporter [Actinomycetia bacterium]|nr:MFS transporter [Actinomycetes bacterium]
MLGTVLAVAMAAATFAPIVFGVLASELISSLRIERWQVGVLVTASTLGGAFLSVWLGGWGAIATLVVAGASLLFIGLAPGLILMSIAALFAGIASASSNPATNKLISTEFTSGKQGLIVGVKQSGVQIGVFLGGWLLPVFTIWWGWRWAVIAFAVIPLGVAGMYSLTTTHQPVAPTAATETRSGYMPKLIYRLSVYGFMMGIGLSVVLTYLPLYGEEVFGMSRELGGLAVAVTGLVGIVARLVWAGVAEGRLGSVPSLRIIALLAVVMGVVLALGEQLGAWSVWLAAALTGLSGSAWNAVGMLAIIQMLPTSRAGRGSGVVLFGFLGGLAMGAPLVGWSVDIWGTYTPGWIAITVLFAVGYFVMGLDRR